MATIFEDAQALSKEERKALASGAVGDAVAEVLEGLGFVLKAISGSAYESLEYEAAYASVLAAKENVLDAVDVLD